MQIDDVKNKCVLVDAQITELTRLIATQSTLALTDNRIYAQIDIWKKQLAQLKADFNLNGCVSKLEEVKQATVKEVIDTYQNINKERIDAVSTYERNKRVFFGAFVLITALALIITSEKK